MRKWIKKLEKEKEDLLERAINEIDEKKRKKLFDEYSGLIEVWKIDDPNEKIRVVKEFIEDIKNTHGNIKKMWKYSIRFEEFDPILYPDQINTIKKLLRMLEIENKCSEPIEIWKIVD